MPCSTPPEFAVRFTHADRVMPSVELALKLSLAGLYGAIRYLAVAGSPDPSWLKLTARSMRPGERTGALYHAAPVACTVASREMPPVLSPRCHTPLKPAAVSNTAAPFDSLAAPVLPQCMRMVWVALFPLMVSTFTQMAAAEADHDSISYGRGVASSALEKRMLLPPLAAARMSASLAPRRISTGKSCTSVATFAPLALVFSTMARWPLQPV